MLIRARGERWRRLIVAFIVMTFISGCIAASGFAQDDDERRLWDTELLKNRQPPKGQTKGGKPPVYRRTTPKPAAADDKIAGEMLGVTVWRLRPSSAADNKDSRLLLQDEDKDNNEWTPQRVEAETSFAADERVRLSIESSRGGYL